MRIKINISNIESILQPEFYLNSINENMLLSHEHIKIEELIPSDLISDLFFGSLDYSSIFCNSLSYNDFELLYDIVISGDAEHLVEYIIQHPHYQSLLFYDQLSFLLYEHITLKFSDDIFEKIFIYIDIAGTDNFLMKFINTCIEDTNMEINLLYTSKYIYVHGINKPLLNIIKKSIKKILLRTHVMTINKQKIYVYENKTNC